MQMKLKLTVVATLAMVAGLASAQDAVVKIGHVAPMSGSQAHYGKDNENGARMAIEELNTQNNVIGGKRIKFKLVAEEDAADPKRGTAVETKLGGCKGSGVGGGAGKKRNCHGYERWVKAGAKAMKMKAWMSKEISGGTAKGEMSPDGQKTFTTTALEWEKK